MSNPTFPISVPAEQKRLIRQGNQMYVDDKQGMTESHRKANKSGRIPGPNETKRWTGGALRDE